MPATSAPTSAAAIRSRLVDTLRRDLIGPGPQDADLAHERLKNNPSRWYLAGFLAPALDGIAEGTESVEDAGPSSGRPGACARISRTTRSRRLIAFRCGRWWWSSRPDTHFHVRWWRMSRRAPGVCRCSSRR